MRNKLAVVGPNDIVLAFSSIGVDVFSTTSGTEAKDIISKLVKQDYAIIFLTEKLARECEEYLKRFKTEAFPIIISIPDANGTDGYAMDNIKKDMEKAIGTNIF